MYFVIVPANIGCLVKPIDIQPLDELQQMERNISVSMYVDDGVDDGDADDVHYDS